MANQAGMGPLTRAQARRLKASEAVASCQPRISIRDTMSLEDVCANYIQLLERCPSASTDPEMDPNACANASNAFQARMHLALALVKHAPSEVDLLDACRFLSLAPPKVAFADERDDHDEWEEDENAPFPKPDPTLLFASEEDQRDAIIAKLKDILRNTSDWSDSDWSELVNGA